MKTIWTLADRMNEPLNTLDALLNVMLQTKGSQAIDIDDEHMARLLLLALQEMDSIKALHGRLQDQARIGVKSGTTNKGGVTTRSLDVLLQARA